MKKEKVLIADDEITNRILLSKLLQKLNYEVVECSSGSEVADIIFKKELPQIVILDWMMPDLLGIEIAEQIKHNYLDQFTYVILLTSKHGVDDILRALRIGVNDYITKPIKSEELGNQIKQAQHTVELYRTMKLQKEKMASAAKLTVLAEMAAGVAHEINNPLAIISGKCTLIDLMLNDVNNIENVKVETEKIRVTIDRIAKIVKALRTYASGSAELEAEKGISIQSVINDCIMICHKRISRDGVEIKFSGFEQEPGVIIQVSQFTQMLVNLIINACDAIIGSAEKWIEFKYSENHEHIMIEVIDSGHGVENEIQDKIFNPFFSTREVGQGTGLGLSVAQTLARNMKGDLVLKPNTINTTFEIILPICKKIVILSS